MEEKYVYVIYDTLYERVVCVHDEPDMECDVCKTISEDKTANRGVYTLEECERVLVCKKKE